MKNKLWFQIFLRVAAIFAAFVLVLTLCNAGLLTPYFSHREKTRLREQTARVTALDLSDSAAVSELLSEISEQYRFEVEIYAASGAILYTTYGSQMMDYFALAPEHPAFVMSHYDLPHDETEELSGGITFFRSRATIDGGEYLVCSVPLSDGYTAELRCKTELIRSAAQTANELIGIVSAVCFALSIVWVLLFARAFSKPICEMNEITSDMKQLRFERRLEISGNNEIAQLAESINGLSESLSEALRDLKERNKGLLDEIEAERRLDSMRKEFVANVSHELKTPLSVISGYAEGLKCGISPERTEEYCNIIIDESVRMNKLVLSLLELSRYESGQLSPAPEVFDLAPMLREMADRILQKKPLCLQNAVKQELFVLADPTLIEQVVKAYLENAAAYTPENGEVRIAAADEGEKIRIEVFNTGSRVADEDMERIWQSFFRADKARSRENGHFGLGLSAVSAIMRLHGNACGVYNTESGVCFWFELQKANP